GRLVAYGLSSSLTRGKRELKRVIGDAAGWGAMYLLKLLSWKKRFMVYSIQMLKRREPEGVRQDFTTLLRLLDRGELKPLVYRRLPLEQAALAQELLTTSETVGKIVLINQ